MSLRLSHVRSLPVAFVAVVTLAFVSVTPTQAAFVNITFDAGGSGGALAVGTILSNQYAAFGVTFSPNAFTGAGSPTGAWATNTNMGIVSSTGSDVGSLGTPSLVSGNLLRSFNGWLGEDGDPSFVANFSTPISTLSASFAGIATPSSTRLFAYNGTTLLTTAVATGTGQQTLTVSSATPITSVRFAPGDFSDWVGVDNISYNTDQAPVAVPEPASLTFMAIGGVTALGLSRRRRASAGPVDGKA